MAYEYVMPGKGRDVSGWTTAGWHWIANSEEYSKIRENIPKYSQIYAVVAYGEFCKCSGLIQAKGWIADQNENRLGDEKTIAATNNNSMKAMSADITKYIHSENANAGEFKNITGLKLCFSGGLTEYITDSKKIYFTFNKPTYTLNVASGNSNMGSVSGGGTVEIQTYSQTMTITATAKSGYRFKRWSDGNTSASRTITITQDNSEVQGFTTTITLTAEFEEDGINKIWVGNQQPKSIYLGNSPIKMIYLGNTIIYKS